MNRLLKIAVPVIIMAAAATVAVAGSHGNKAAEKAIKARQAQMQMYVWNLSNLGAMAKGAVDYDAKMAMSYANNLSAMVNHNSSSMWPQGSDSTAMPGMTRAKAEAWTTYPKVVEKQKDLNMAVAALVEVAGNGQAALGGALKGVGASCGGCHKPFREDKK
jgi:cytochrome c556